MDMLTSLFVPTKKNNYKPHLLRKVAIVCYSIILVLVNGFGGLLGVGYAQASTITAENIINLTNSERIAWGLNTLQPNSQLSAAALAKANNMFEEQYWDHFGPNGESPWQFIRAAGYDYVYAGENLGKGFRTAEGLHEAWMASPTHKENVISRNYKDIGVAVVDGILLGKQTTLVVQMFGNLTSDVHGSSAVEPSVPNVPAPTPVLNLETEPSVEKKVIINREVGEIKSISITSPKEGAIVTNASMNVKGETSNISGEYTVQIY
ncbi:MAG: CAP domain-containing protein, partial [Candidatus Dojkabacteria bacterium]